MRASLASWVAGDVKRGPLDLHYVGNFWWASAAYVAALPAPASLFDVGAAPNYFGSARHGLSSSGWGGGGVAGEKDPAIVALSIGAPPPKWPAF